MMPNGYTYKVQIEGTTGFILDTDLLDTGVLGYLLTDVTEYVRSVRIKTGRSTIQDKFTAGQMTIIFDNRNRVFDPNYTSSPIYGAVKPRRRIIFSITANYELRVFTGTIDTWSYDYDVSTESTATVSASDSFAVLANQNVTLTAPASESTDTRYLRVLRDPSVSWPSEYIGVGNTAFTMGTASYSGNALAYLQQLADSERGYLSMDQYGVIMFFGWNYFVNSYPFVYFSDAGSTAIAFTSIETTYDTDQFYNYVSVTGYPGTVITQNTTSQNDYGISAGEFPVLQSGTAQMAYVATHINQKFSEPRFRISKLTVSLDDPRLLAIDVNGGYPSFLQSILGLIIGDYAQITWTPNNVGTATSQAGYIIGIEIDATPERCNFSFSFSADDTRGAYP